LIEEIEESIEEFSLAETCVSIKIKVTRFRFCSLIWNMKK